MTDTLLKGKPGVIARVEVPAMRFFAIDGQGVPGGPVHVAAVGALYALAYGARFAGKARGHDEKVGPLEGLVVVRGLRGLPSRAATATPGSGRC